MPDMKDILGLGPLDVDLGFLGPDISAGVGADISLGPDNCQGRELTSPFKQDNSVSVLTQLVQQQGQMLKELSSRLDNLNSKSTPLPVELHDSHESTDQVELHVDSEERIGNSDLDEPNEERE